MQTDVGNYNLYDDSDGPQRQGTSAQNMSCGFVFGSNHRQLQQLLEDERSRHAEAENQWKEEKRKLIADAAASANLKAKEDRQTALKSDVRFADNMGGSRQQIMHSDLNLCDEVMSEKPQNSYHSFVKVPCSFYFFPEQESLIFITECHYELLLAPKIQKILLLLLDIMTL